MRFAISLFPARMLRLSGNADDWLHGSPAYYEEIARQLVRQFALT